MGTSHAGCYADMEVITVKDYLQFKYKFIYKNLSHKPWDNDSQKDLNAKTQIFITTDVKAALVKWGTEFSLAALNNSLH